MLITLQKVNKSFGADPVLCDITAGLDKGDRVGLIGENGAGKTTLIRVILGQLHIDSGEVSLGRGVTVGYLEQNAALDTALCVYEEMRTAYAPALQAMEELRQLEAQLAAEPENQQLLARHAQASAIIDAQDAYQMDVQIKNVLSGMGFGSETYEKKVSVLSGGERTRLQLAKLLLQNPDMLILDEPTNHLDFATLEWLEEYLSGYGGAILTVSHDRYFLDAVTNRIWELEDTHLTVYRGNYSAYLPQKEAQRALQQKQHDADVAKAQKLQDYVDRNLVRASTTKMAQSRRKQLEKMEITEKPKTQGYKLRFRFEYDLEPYEDVLTARKLTVKAGEKLLVQQLDLKVLRGERLIIAGPNGTGKSTLLKVLSGQRLPESGSVRLGSGVQAGYFEQQQHRRGGRVIDAIWNRWPQFTELEVRSLLARFYFKGEEVFKDVQSLSGGELSRLRFAELFLERPNLLLLDEPTNHLDIYMRESLGQALEQYTGTLVLITHDRYLMKSLGCPILYLEDGKGSFYESFDAMRKGTAAAAQQPLSKEKPAEPARKNGLNQKEERRLKAEVRAKAKELERKIEQLGADITGMENDLALPEITSNHVKLTELCDALDDARFAQQEAYDAWEKLLEEYPDYLE
ncbi:MAG: ABC-F family ATP-binding cassette domain-containing protein [Pygmaiobacter massiliensis]|nr:ABC-F family ATP-binding cassette domain-containing protein [Pygmaiobacter massiliensis]